VLQSCIWNRDGFRHIQESIILNLLNLVVYALLVVEPLDMKAGELIHVLEELGIGSSKYRKAASD